MNTPPIVSPEEEWEDSPEGYPQTPTGGWVNNHDAYDDKDG